MRKNQGLTLIEIMVVIGIIAMIISLGMVVDFNSLKGDTFNKERATIVATLSSARSHAMANLFQSAYGACYIEPNYIIFRGRATCLPVANTDETIPADVNIASNSGSIFPTIIFDQLTGNAISATVHITDGIKSSDITINNEGTISW